MKVCECLLESLGNRTSFQCVRSSVTDSQGRASHANQVQKLVQEMVDQRWQRACERRRTDGGLAQAAFRRQWEAPNLAVVHPDGQRVTVTMLMRASTRASWAERNETIQTRNRRMQQYEPPKVLPPDTVSVFIHRRVGGPT